MSRRIVEKNLNEHIHQENAAYRRIIAATMESAMTEDQIERRGSRLHGAPHDASRIRRLHSGDQRLGRRAIRAEAERVMRANEKIRIMAKALNDLNKLVYANTIVVGSQEYFTARDIAVKALNAVGERVE